MWSAIQQFLVSSLAQNLGLVLLYLALMSVIGRKSQIDAWCMKQPKLAGVIKILRGVLPDPFLLVQGIALIVLKRLPLGYQALLLDEEKKTDAS